MSLRLCFFLSLCLAFKSNVPRLSNEKTLWASFPTGSGKNKIVKKKINLSRHIERKYKLCFMVPAAFSIEFLHLELYSGIKLEARLHRFSHLIKIDIVETPKKFIVFVWLTPGLRFDGKKTQNCEYNEISFVLLIVIVIGLQHLQAHGKGESRVLSHGLNKKYI